LRRAPCVIKVAESIAVCGVLTPFTIDKIITWPIEMLVHHISYMFTRVTRITVVASHVIHYNYLYSARCHIPLLLLLLTSRHGLSRHEVEVVVPSKGILWVLGLYLLTWKRHGCSRSRCSRCMLLTAECKHWMLGQLPFA
jgi:hypothetical protein